MKFFIKNFLKSFYFFFRITKIFIFLKKFIIIFNEPISFYLNFNKIQIFTLFNIINH